MYAKFAARDATIIALAVFVWWLIAARSGGSGTIADLCGFVAGVMLGVTAFLLHEWGHVLAGLAAGSAMAINENLRSPSMFSFDAGRNSLKQFVIMSLGGFAVTAVLLFSYYTYLPDTLLASRVARGAVGFLALLAIVLELPLFLFAIFSGNVPAVAAVKVDGPALPRSF